MTHLIIAPKASRRAAFWIQLLEHNKLKYLHISYVDIIANNFDLDKNIQYLVRLESAGEDFQTYQSIIHLGENSVHLPSIEENFGEISNFGAWYKGWEKLLSKIQHLEKQFQLKFINHPSDILRAFNKNETQKILSNNNVACPTILKATNYNALITEMRAKKIPQVFIKPCSGSSASGVIAFRYLNTQKQVAYTTIKNKEGKYYNSLKIQRYTLAQEIQEIFNEIAKSPLQIERWIPKWQFNNMNIDFRVVVINKKVEFIVPRGSRSPITNLHLGNKKLKIEELNLSAEVVKKIEQEAIKAMQCFPKLHYAGVDVLLSKNAKVFILEINPFGDLLLNIVNKNNRTTYEQELASLSQTIK